MYQRPTPRQLAGLGLSARPPAWLRNAAKNAVNDLVNKARDEATAALNASKRPAASPVDQVNDAVAGIPGGWLTILGLGVGALMLLKPHRS